MIVWIYARSSLSTPLAGPAGPAGPWGPGSPCGPGGPIGPVAPVHGPVGGISVSGGVGCRGGIVPGGSSTGTYGGGVVSIGSSGGAPAISPLPQPA